MSRRVGTSNTADNYYRFHDNNINVIFCFRYHVRMRGRAGRYAQRQGTFVGINIQDTLCVVHGGQDYKLFRQGNCANSTK